MSEVEKKTSYWWGRDINPKDRIIDPDGWDRRNFKFSFHKEEITEEEYRRRFIRSTTEIHHTSPFAMKVKS